MAGGMIVIIALVAVAITLLIAVPVTFSVAVSNKAKKDAETIGTAEEKARNIIDEALKTAETKKREALLEAKEESLKTKNELEKETRERRNELQKYEKRVLAKEESVDRKADAIERVMDYYHANMEDTIALGDSMNDYQMLEKANQGIVFEGAKEKLLDIAYDTFKDPDQDGIALSLEKLGLI